MQRSVFLLVVLAAAFVFATAVAGQATTYDPDNELVNWCFIDGGTEWEVTGPVVFNQSSYDKFGRPHVAFDPFPTNPGPAGTLRQIVDDSKSSTWNPALNHKIGTLEFDLYTTGTGYVMVGFDWWDYMGNTKPVGAAPHEAIIPTQYTSLNEWTHVVVPYDWVNVQPRWVSVEFAFYGCGGGGNEASVDDAVFKAQCVPEPSSVLALSAGLLGLTGAVLRRRR